MAAATDLPIHFFTIVLNGEPFIRYHFERMNRLPFRWHWHIVEGLADLRHDTQWSVVGGGKVPDGVARESRSVDGTAEYIDELARQHPSRITIYRSPEGRLWQT